MRNPEVTVPSQTNLSPDILGLLAAFGAGELDGISIDDQPNGALSLHMDGKLVAVLDADNNLAETFPDNPENFNPSSDESEDV